MLPRLTRLPSPLFTIDDLLFRICRMEQLSESEDTRRAGIATRYAEPAELEFVSADGYIPEAAVRRKIGEREIIMAELDGQPAGYLRLEFLWSRVPFIALIRVLPEFRRRGIGRALLAFAQRELGLAGHAALYSSSQADEPEPQAWHRHVGFEECGFIAAINDNGIGEVFFRKAL